MSLLALLLAVAMGALVGVLSGLLGIGGGIVMVPFFYLLMAMPEWSGLVVASEHQTALAHATSLAVILPTAVSGFLSYRRQGTLDWDVVLPLGVPAGGAAIVGALLAVAMPGPLLRVGFAIVLLVSCLRLLHSDGGSSATLNREAGSGVSKGAAVVGGAGVGLLSALLGIGGGIVAIPILLNWVGLELKRVAAASIGIVAFAAPAGILSYAAAGWGVEGMPGGTVGYVAVPLALAMIPGAVLLAPLGTRINQALPVRHLRRAFGILMLVVGIRLLWSNLPQLPGLWSG
ncbi:MAG: sulfite exporter TauE/SafE family protein [Gemmatimonadales bacterium]|nr:MAG: sulfite exporter TauE/SafE family protein [Gemmatimonadales bacterium]